MCASVCVWWKDGAVVHKRTVRLLVEECRLARHPMQWIMQKVYPGETAIPQCPNASKRPCRAVGSPPGRTAAR